MSRARTHLRLLVPAMAALLALAFASTAQADYEQVGLFGQSGNGEQLFGSNGIAVNATGAGGVEAGSVYIAAGQRVSRYNAEGEIKEVWGKGTIASGPDLPNQVNTLKVDATSGTYELEVGTARGRAKFTEGSKVATDVFAEVGSFHVGDSLRRQRGTGNITAGSNTITSVSLVSGFWTVGMTIHGPGIPTNTTITEGSFNGGTETYTLTLSQAATETRVGASLTAETLVTAVGPGTIESSVAAEVALQLSVTGTETTTPIPYNASATELKEALVALPAFGPGDISVSGTPGNYEITFEGAYAGSPVGLESTESTLAGGVPSSSVAIATSVAASTPGFQRCRVDNGDVCASQRSNIFAPSAEGFSELEGVTVDQSTGYVYVVNAADTVTHTREHNLIEVLSADGSEVIARFGDAGPKSESFEAGPAKLHPISSEPRRIAVDESGKVYLTDIGNSGTEFRVMCFQPESAGDYQHYAYCGRPQDIKVNLSGFFLSQLALDNAGHIYVGSQQTFQELSPAEPTAPPLCTFNTNGQAYAMTVNPLNGEVFYYNSSNEKIGRLKPCDPAKGKFEAAQAPVKSSPPAVEIRALAFNPTLSWAPNRPPGVLYGAERAQHGTETNPLYKGLGYILAPAEVHSPEVLSESVSNTRTTSAFLHAEINPNGFGTRYVFQYESEAEYEANDPGERFAGAREVPAGGGEISGSAVGQATAAVSGLTPDTAYRFRAIATSECNGAGGEPCTSEGEVLAFATYPLYLPGLPDHRTYEMVSLAQKHGGEVIPADPEIGSCKECKPNSFGVIFPMQSTPDGEALAYEGQPFTPLEGAINYDSYVARRTASGWQSTALIPALPPEGVGERAFDAPLNRGLLTLNYQLELQDTAEPDSRTPLLTEEAPNRGPGVTLSYGGHSSDFSRVFFAANDTLTEETPFAPEPPDPGASKKDLYEWHEGQLALVNVLPGNATVATGASFASTSPDTHAVSADGTRVFWKDEAGNLYVRENGETTRQIDDAGHFLSASPDGSEVLLDDGCLYSLESESCRDLTEGKGGFKGLVGQSRDLSQIYFVDSAVLAANEGAGLDSEGNPQVAEAGQNNFYGWSGGEAQFIAQLAAKDNVPGQLSTTLNDWDPSPSHRSAEASPSGRFLAFASLAPLSGYDNIGPCGIELKSGVFVTVPGPCQEAFLYDSVTGKLTCASCNPTGEAPLGNSTLRRIKGAPEELPQPRYLTDEGRLYFDTRDSLVARDTNEGVEDVYEYSPQGAGAQGTCEREAGCTRLISAGTEAVDSNLIAIDETGKNVFFDTRDKLALKDKDELLDVYDAREGGGIAAESEISRAECQGENCQTPVTPPNDPTPGSSTFEGAGNVKEPAVAKKHAKKHKKAKKHSRTAKRNHGGVK